MKKIISSVLILTFLLGTSNISTHATTIEPYDFDYMNSDVTFTKTESSTKGIININSCKANKLFNFKFNLNPGETLITAKELLGDDCDTGEVFVIDAYKNIKQIIEKPWAIDANGKKIPTYFNVSGNILTQTVDHSCEDSFPITADPNAWQITRCAGAIAGLIISIGMPIAKIMAIKRGIKIAGGLQIFARLLIGLLTKKMTLKDIGAYGPIVMQAIGILTGIGDVVENCTW